MQLKIKCLVVLCLAFSASGCLTLSAHAGRPPQSLAPLAGKAPRVGGHYRVDEYADISYIEGGDDGAQALDIFLPHNARKAPIVFFVHGGGWIIGTKDTAFAGVYSDIGPYLASRGIGVVTINYRKFPWYDTATGLRDVAKALAWTKAHIGEYGGDASSIFFAGHSAGGHITALFGTDESYLRTVGMSFADIKGFIPMSPPCDTEHFGSLLSPLVNAILGDAKDRRAISPMRHIHKGLRPFLVVYAEHELAEVSEQAQEFCTRIGRLNRDVTCFEAKNRTHVTSLSFARTDDDPVANKLISFVAAHAGMKIMPPESRNDSGAAVATTRQPYWTTAPPFAVTETYPKPAGIATLGLGVDRDEAWRTRHFMDVGLLPYLELEAGGGLVQEPGEKLHVNNGLVAFKIPLVRWGLIPLNPSLYLAASPRIGGNIDYESRLVLTEDFDSNFRLAMNGIERLSRTNGLAEHTVGLHAGLGYSLFCGILTPSIEGARDAVGSDLEGTMLGGGLLLRPAGSRWSFQGTVLEKTSTSEQGSKAVSKMTVSFDF